MKPGKVTSIDVAERAGVSQSAVSRVFTPGASASQKTADKVLKAARELGYRPNTLARAMITGKSRIIGLVVAYLENYFYPDVLERLSNGLQAEGYHVLIFMASPTAGNIDPVVDEILDYQVDGIVLASVDMASELSERCQAAGVPVVQVNRTQRSKTQSSVTSDNYAGGRAVADFLVAGGHKTFGYIAGYEGASTQRAREAGYREGLAAHGHEISAREVGNFVLAEAQDAARAMLADPDQRPDALFVCNDHMAFATMDVARFELGLSVPGDVSIVGFDDVPIAAWPAYDLTSVRQPAEGMVAETIALLTEQIDTPGAPCRHVELEAPLMVRGSARIPKGWTT